MNLPTCITQLLVAFGFTQLVAISGCVDSSYSQYRDQKTEELIGDFYTSSREKLVITSMMGGSKIDAYCVLVPYQFDLNEEDNLIVPANAFLSQIDLTAQEDYWHIVVKSLDQFILLRINQRVFPLLTPASYLKNNCVVGNTLVITKSVIPPNKHQTIKIGH